MRDGYRRLICIILVAFRFREVVESRYTERVYIPPGDCFLDLRYRDEQFLWLYLGKPIRSSSVRFDCFVRLMGWIEN